MALRSAYTAAAVVLLGALTWSGSAVAQADEAPNSEGTVSKVLQGLKVKTEVGQMPDFVVKSRPPPDSLHYIPVGGPRPEPAAPQMTVDEIKAEEAELDALKQQHDHIGARKSDATHHASVADGRKPPKSKPARPKCILTCDVLALPKPGDPVVQK
jgi:hypothetical protein